MYRSKHAFMSAQRGISLSGLIAVMAVLGLIAVLAMKIFPTFVEYRSIMSAIASAKATDGTRGEVLRAFSKSAEINMIDSIKGKDLIISRESGQLQVGFAYEKRIPLFGNVSLVIDYSGTTDPSGIVPEKPETEVQ